MNRREPWFGWLSARARSRVSEREKDGVDVSVSEASGLSRHLFPSLPRALPPQRPPGPGLLFAEVALRDPAMDKLPFQH